MTWPDTWVILAVAAAAAQTIRFAIQKVLAAGALSAAGATWARFAFSAPLVSGLVVLYAGVVGRPAPEFSWAFAGWAATGGVSQILATVCTVALFSHRAFAIGITLKKTEVLITALAGFLLLGDRVAPLGVAAIALGMLGVLVLSSTPGALSFDRRAITLGLGSGLFFALSAVGYRGATLAIETGDTLYTSGAALAVVTAGQALGLGIWLARFQPGEITRTLKQWRAAAVVGATSMLGSWCWFAAFSLANAAYVFAVGQVELVFSVLLGAIWFAERLTRREVAGMAILMVSILGVVVIG